MAGPWVLGKASFFRALGRSFLWPSLNLPSNTSFGDRTVCILCLVYCRELNMPLIFICAVKTASTCSPLREIAKINERLTYTKWRNKQKYLFSIHRPQGLLRVRTNYQQHYRTPSRHWLSLWRPGLYRFVSSFLWERSIQKHNQRKIIYILNAVSSWLLGVNVSNFILFGVIITRPLSTKWFKYFILLNSDSFHFSTITDISHIMKQARWELVGLGYLAWQPEQQWLLGLQDSSGFKHDAIFP